MVSVGGRYDALLRSVWSPAASAAGALPPAAVGATVNVEKLRRFVAQSHSTSASGRAVAAADPGRVVASQVRSNLQFLIYFNAAQYDYDRST